MRVTSFILFSSLLFSCQSKEQKLASSQKGEAEYFSPTEVIAALNALVAIIDWPQETTQQQKNLSVNLESAKQLMLPLHPLWDEKVSEAAMEMPNWDEAKIQAVVGNCVKTCECDFYQEVLDKNPMILETSPKFKVLSEMKYVKTKEAVLECMQKMVSIQKLLTYLRKEQSAYQAPGP